MKAGMTMEEMISKWVRNEVADRVVMYNDRHEVGNATFFETNKTTH